MKPVREIVPDDFPVGGGIGDLLQANPMAVRFAHDEMVENQSEKNEEPSTGSEEGDRLFGDYASWLATRLPHLEDPQQARNVIFRSMVVAYAVAKHVHPDYTPSVRATPDFDNGGADEQYRRLAVDASRVQYRYPILADTGEVTRTISDPEGTFEFHRQLGTLAGFTMIHYADVASQWFAPQHEQLEQMDGSDRAIEVGQLERLFDAG